MVILSVIYTQHLRQCQACSAPQSDHGPDIAENTDQNSQANQCRYPRPERRYLIFRNHGTAAAEYSDKTLTVHHITICANRVTADTGTYQFSLFDDVEKMEKEKKLQKALVCLKKRYGKNSTLKGTNYMEGATMRELYQQIGGHKS